MIWLISILMVLNFNEKEGVTLDDLKWKNRIVLYFPIQGQEIKIDLNALEVEIKERKIIFLSIGEKFTTNSEAVFQSDYLESLQEKFAMEKNQSNWVLIGLDGGVKLNKEGLPDWEYIFKTIDSMPMRQSEIRKSF